MWLEAERAGGAETEVLRDVVDAPAEKPAFELADPLVVVVRSSKSVGL